MTKKDVSITDLPLYQPAGMTAGGVGSLTDRVDGQAKGSMFGGLVNSSFKPSNAIGKVVTVHNGLDVNRDAKLGLKMFDQIQAFSLDVSPATEALMVGNLFHRLFELRNPQQIVTPPVPLFENFVFPRNAAWHYVSTDGLSLGPDPRDIRLRETNKRTLVSNVTQLTSQLGNPIPLIFNIKAESDKWYRTTRVFRRSYDAITEAKSEQILPVVNYAWLNKMFRYTRSIYTERYRWENIWRTVFSNIYSYLENGDEHTHFIFINLPKTLVPLSVMQNLVDRSMQQMIRKIQDEDQWMIFEMWKWIDPEHRSKSLLSVFKNEMLDKLRIVILDGPRFTVFNPSSIDRWTKDPARPRDSAVVDPQQMQRRFVRGLMTVMEHRIPIAENVEFETDEESKTHSEIQPTVNGTPVSEDPSNTVQTETELPEEQIGNKTSAGDAMSAADKAEIILQSMDQDLDALEKIGNNSVKEDEEDQTKVIDDSITELNEQIKPAKTTFDAQLTPTQALKARVDKLADQGAISVTDYRKYNRLIEQSEVIPSGYDSEYTVKEMADIKPDDTELKQKEKLVDRATVIDKTMLNNTLDKFDGEYIENYLKRDIVSMLVQAQNGGAILTKHTVEVQEDAMGSYEYHTVSYQPIEGQASLLRFKIPVVSKTGRVKSGGAQLVLRKQRVD